MCARAVHDGETHQFTGGLFAVPPGREAELLDLLDEGDPVDIARWVSGLYRPPTLATREGEPMVECELEIRVSDPAGARRYLEATYEAEGSDDQTMGGDVRPQRRREDPPGAPSPRRGPAVCDNDQRARADRVLAATRGVPPSRSQWSPTAADRWT